MSTELFETPCLCYARDALRHEPESYKWVGGILWGIWAECPTHHEHFTSITWTRWTGRIVIEEAAAEKATAR